MFLVTSNLFGLNPTRDGGIMYFLASQLPIESFIPAITGATLIFLALLGLRELLKETTVAFRKRINT